MFPHFHGHVHFGAHSVDSECSVFDPFLGLISSFCPGHKNLPPLHPKSLNMREFATVTVGGADVFLSRRLRCVLISFPYCFRLTFLD